MEDIAYEAEAHADLHDAIDWPIALDENAKRRLVKIADDLGRDPYDLMRTSIEEAALNYFRGRDDDPAI